MRASYISYLTYLLCAALLIVGGKIAKGKGNFHQDSTSLEVTKSLRGFAAIGVILHHISQQEFFQSANGLGKPGVLSLFVNAVFFFVAIFFFCSGYGLIKSLYTKENYLDGFLKKRVVKTIVIPFYINVILYAIFNILTGVKLAPGRWICNFLGLTLMNAYAWYPIVLTILYLAFYLIFKNIKNKKICFGLMLFIILAQGILFCFNGHFVWWTGPKNWWLNSYSPLYKLWWTQEKIFLFSGEWWVNSSIAFFVGMLFAHHEEKIRCWFSKLFPLKLFLLILLFAAFTFLSQMAQWKFGYWTEWNGKGPGIVNKLVTYTSQLPQITIFVILLFAIMLKYHVKNPVLNFFGNISFETYMMNYIALSIMIYALPKKIGALHLLINEVGVIALTIALGLLFKLLCKLVCKLLCRKIG